MQQRGTYVAMSNRNLSVGWKQVKLTQKRQSDVQHREDHRLPLHVNPKTLGGTKCCDLKAN